MDYIPWIFITICGIGFFAFIGYLVLITYSCTREWIRIYNKSHKNHKRKRLEKNTRNRECLIDINNCSEMELTRLAGVNIVLAKKIVIKREEIQGFKSKKEFINFIKLKPHFQNKIENSIIIKKVKINKPIKLTKERIIDL